MKNCLKLDFKEASCAPSSKTIATVLENISCLILSSENAHTLNTVQDSLASRRKTYHTDNKTCHNTAFTKSHKRPDTKMSLKEEDIKQSHIKKLRIPGEGRQRVDTETNRLFADGGGVGGRWNPAVGGQG